MNTHIPLLRYFSLSFRHFSSSFPFILSFPRKRESCNNGTLGDSRLRGNDRKILENDIKSGNTRSSRWMTKLRGFTLLEVMIALLVITLGMAAVINTTSESGWKSAQLRHKMVATWVAQNQIVKYRANRIWGNAKSQSGKVEMANIDWVWRMQISATDDPSLRRLDVEVFIEGEDALKARLTGFIGRI